MAGEMTEFDIKRGFYDKIEGAKLGALMKEVFGNVSEENGCFVSSYGVMARIEAKVLSKTQMGLLTINVEDTKSLSDEEILNSKRMLNKFLEESTGFTAKQHQTTGHETTSQHAVQFTITHVDPHLVGCYYVLQPFWKTGFACKTAFAVRPLRCRTASLNDLFLIGAPLSANRTATEHLRGFSSAGRTDILYRCFCHQISITSFSSARMVFSKTGCASCRKRLWSSTRAL